MMIELTSGSTAGLTASGGNIVDFYAYATRRRQKQPRPCSFEESLIMLGGYNIVSLAERRNP